MRMFTVRKVVLAVFAAALLLTPALASAQNGVGFKAGINMATFKITPSEGTDNVGKLRGFAFGIYVPSPAKATAKFQTEILYSEKGAKDKNSGDKVKLTYIDVPILERIKLSGDAPVHAHVHVGPVLSYRLKVDSTAPESGIETKADTKAYDVGIAIGGDIDTTFLEFDVRYTMGFVNVLKDAPEGVKYKNSMLSFLVGIHTAAK